MSISGQIRDVLRIASGPMTAKEVREALDVECPADAISKLLSALTAGGQIVRDGEPGNFTYIIDSKAATPKRAGAIEKPTATSPPPATKPAKGKKAKTGAAPAKLNSIVDDRIITTAHVALPIADLRLITSALIERHPTPMPAALRDAVVGALKVTL